MAELKVLKMRSGDNVLAVIEDDVEESEKCPYIEDAIYIRGAMKIVKEYNKRKKTHEVFLVDWFPESGSELTPVRKDEIISIDIPNAVIEDHYFDLVLRQMNQSDLTEEQSPERLRDLQQKQELLEYDFSDDLEQ